jgi:hypothetical protein
MISRVAGLAAIVAGTAAVALRKQVRLLGSVHMAMAGLILWSAITLCWSVTPDLTVQRLMTSLQLFVMVLMIWELCVEETDVVQILGAFVLGTILPALSTLRAFLPGQETLQQRAAVAGYDPNGLAFMLAISLPVAYYLILRDKSAISALYRLQMGFAVCAILLSGSAATMVAMVVGLSLVFWTAHILPARSRVNAFALIMVLAGAGIVFTPAGLWRHISEESRNGGITLSATVDNGVQTLRSAPVGGYGAGTMGPAASGTRVRRNTTPTLISETGVVGVGCFFAILGVLVMSAERMSGASKSFWLTVIAVWAVGVCAANAECSQPAWLLFGLLASHAASVKQDGVTQVERKQRRNYYVEQSAEVWS